MIRADKTEMGLGLHHQENMLDVIDDDMMIEEQDETSNIKRSAHHEIKSVICVMMGLTVLCCLYEDPLFLASRLLRGEFPDNDAFVAFLEFYHT